jgi:hypothetical protein
MKPQDYFTRPASNKGAKMPLVDPATGKETGDFLFVLGLESDAFAQAIIAKRKRSLEIEQMPEDKRSAEEDDNELDLYAALVTGWSFDPKGSPFSKDAIKELFKEAPRVRMAVDKFASNIANFTARQSGN